MLSHQNEGGLFSFETGNLETGCFILLLCCVKSHPAWPEGSGSLELEPTPHTHVQCKHTHWLELKPISSGTQCTRIWCKLGLKLTWMVCEEQSSSLQLSLRFKKATSPLQGLVKLCNKNCWHALKTTLLTCLRSGPWGKQGQSWLSEQSLVGWIHAATFRYNLPLCRTKRFQRAFSLAAVSLVECDAVGATCVGFCRWCICLLLFVLFFNCWLWTKLLLRDNKVTLYLEPRFPKYFTSKWLNPPFFYSFFWHKYNNL